MSESNRAIINILTILSLPLMSKINVCSRWKISWERDKMNEGDMIKTNDIVQAFEINCWTQIYYSIYISSFTSNNHSFIPLISSSIDDLVFHLQMNFDFVFNLTAAVEKIKRFYEKTWLIFNINTASMVVFQWIELAFSMFYSKGIYS